LPLPFSEPRFACAGSLNRCVSHDGLVDRLASVASMRRHAGHRHPPEDAWSHNAWSRTLPSRRLDRPESLRRSQVFESPSRRSKASRPRGVRAEDAGLARRACSAGLRRASLVLGEGIVRVAIQPAFTFFSRGDHWMTCATGVLAGVPVGGRVTTARPAAGLTGSQMYPPRRPHRHAVLTHPRSRRPDRLHCLDVGASAALSNHWCQLSRQSRTRPSNLSGYR
jgi:hypothetical protein